ncbi:MAG: hypothetical protein M1561_02095 [Gammaproteobacteria bacterium]|nr:hypothetical protein [Gammaproteobacteria bacterium]
MSSSTAIVSSSSASAADDKKSSVSAGVGGGSSAFFQPQQLQQRANASNTNYSASPLVHADDNQLAVKSDIKAQVKVLSVERGDTKTTETVNNNAFVYAPQNTGIIDTRTTSHPTYCRIL